MNITATEAKNRLGHVLEQAQHQPVFIEKSGRRHSVVISAQRYEELLAAQTGTQRGASSQGKRFYEQYKDWVDAQNRLVHEHGVFGEQYRPW